MRGDAIPGARMKPRRPTASALILCAALLGPLSAGCSGGASAPSSPATSAEAGLRLVSLGDSDATGAGDEQGRGWVQRYADLVAKEAGTAVEVIAHAQEGLTSDALLAALDQDEVLRDDIRTADFVVIGAGGADMNAGDDAWDAGTCSGTTCYEPGLAAYAENIAAVSALIADLRAGEPTVFRAMTPPNGLTGAEDVVPPFLVATATEVGAFQSGSLRESTCAAVREHGGECVDVMTDFNGPDGTEDAYASGLMNHADCCYPSAKGQQRIAELLLETGIDAQDLS
jgi:lysophospholipase L1-like esterase